MKIVYFNTKVTVPSRQNRNAFFAQNFDITLNIIIQVIVGAHSIWPTHLPTWSNFERMMRDRKQICEWSIANVLPRSAEAWLKPEGLRFLLRRDIVMHVMMCPFAKTRYGLILLTFYEKSGALIRWRRLLGIIRYEKWNNEAILITIRMKALGASYELMKNKENHCHILQGKLFNW